MFLRRDAFTICVYLISFFLCSTGKISLAQNDGTAAENIQTEVGLDQIAESGNADEGHLTGGGATPQLKAINESLKNAIEENKKLTQETKALENELKELRGASEINMNRINFLTAQRDNLQGRIEETGNLNKQYAEQIERLKADLEKKEKEFDAKFAEIKQEEEQKKAEDEKVLASILPKFKDPREAAAQEKELQDLKKQAEDNLVNFENNAEKITSKVSQLNLENKKLRTETARLHYNLANTFFERGQYDLAAKE